MCPRWTLKDHIRQSDSKYSLIHAAATSYARRNRQCRRTLRPMDAVFGLPEGLGIVIFAVFTRFFINRLQELGCEAAPPEIPAVLDGWKLGRESNIVYPGSNSASRLPMAAVHLPVERACRLAVEQHYLLWWVQRCPAPARTGPSFRHPKGPEATITNIACQNNCSGFLARAPALRAARAPGSEA